MDGIGGGEGGVGKGVGTNWQDTVKQSGAGGTLTPADRHGSVQVSQFIFESFSYHNNKHNGTFVTCHILSFMNDL